MADTETKVITAREFIDAGHLPDYIGGEHDIIYASGSVADGLGNSASDTDLFIIRPSDSGNSGGRIVVDERAMRDGYRFDTECYNERQVLDVRAEIDTVDTSDVAAVQAVSLGSIDLYYRTLIGKPFRNHDRFVALRDSLDRDRLAAVLAKWCFYSAASMYDSVASASASGDHVRAARLARPLLARVVDGYLALHDEPYPGFKWRFEKLARACGSSSAVYRQVWELKARGDRDPEVYAREVCKLCSDLDESDDLLRAGATTGAQSAMGLEASPGAEVVELLGVEYLIDGDRRVLRVGKSELALAREVAGGRKCQLLGQERLDALRTLVTVGFLRPEGAGA
jgi:hypothetical protein